MHPTLTDLVLSTTKAHSISGSTIIQSLWSGYGEIVRLQLQGSEHSSVILKHIKLPDAGKHPRGWNTDLSHQRKIRSYQVEAHWYQEYAARCVGGGAECTVPECLAVTASEDETVLVLTDLDAAGFPLRKDHLGAEQLDDVHACLNWLASFHARFMVSGSAIENCADGLWECGTYWHLDTRPDELEALEDMALREAAPLIDQQLRQCRYQTLVHGDAKLANFCFSADTSKSKVAAVDFQYVGRGCGMKDVAYFIGSCLSEDDCRALEGPLLDYYFSALLQRLTEKQPDLNATEWQNLEAEWRDLYAVAWADFHRFIKGWSPGHWKINSYSEQLTRSVISRLRASPSLSQHSPLSPQQLDELCTIAIQAAKEAGEFIQQFDRSNLQWDFKQTGSSEASQVVTEVDIRSEAIIRERLSAISKPLDIAFVGEESSPSRSGTHPAAPERLQKPYFWCVDPLDGTLPFVEGLPGFAVSIALVDQSGKPLIGVVYEPIEATLLHAVTGQGAYRNLAPLDHKKMEAKSLVAYADASFRTHENHEVAVAALNGCAQHLGLNKVAMVYGSGAVINACHVLSSNAACYLKLPKLEEGGGSIWDFAATACITSEAGGWASDSYGQALQLNRDDSTFMNHQGVLYASNTEIARYLIEAL